MVRTFLFHTAQLMEELGDRSARQEQGKQLFLTVEFDT